MTRDLQNLKVAVVHEWMTTYGGSERVVEQILRLFPDADVFSVTDFLPENERFFLNGKTPSTSFIQNLPFARQAFRNYLPLMPLAVEGFDLSRYDLIISSSHSVAKGVLTGPDQLHICYCHTPIRYAWDMTHQYLRQAGMSKGLRRAMTRMIMHYMRIWDFRTAAGVDLFVANSAYIARRIKKTYGREAHVVYPPVDTSYFRVGSQGNPGYYLSASRLVPYKRVDVVVEAFQHLPNQNLIVVGEGSQMAHCKRLAGRNVQLLGYQSQDRLLSLLQGAKAFVFAAEEDFGISVVEAQACGIPIICYYRGGATESVAENTTGIFFNSQTPEAIASAIAEFETRTLDFDRKTIRQNAERFGSEVFRKQFLELVKREYSKSTQPEWAAAISA